MNDKNGCTINLLVFTFFLELVLVFCKLQNYILWDWKWIFFPLILYVIMTTFTITMFRMFLKRHIENFKKLLDEYNSKINKK